MDNQITLLRNKQILLLRQITLSGSIKQAAQNIGISYKSAWDSIDALNNLFPEPLVIGNVGGKKGGGTQLTNYGQTVLDLFVAVENEYTMFLKKTGLEATLPDTFGHFLKGIYMKTSARNQFFGTVSRILEGVVNSEVVVDVGGEAIKAIITNESVQYLDLSVGKSVYTLIKASFVMLSSDMTGKAVSADNQLLGVVERCQMGAVNAEVTVRLLNDKTIVAIVTNDSVERIGLIPKIPICTFFSGSSVILATEV